MKRKKTGENLSTIFCEENFYWLNWFAQFNRSSSSVQEIFVELGRIDEQMTW